MSAQCNSESMPRRCAEKFEEISHSLGKIDHVAEDVKILRRAVAGNGSTEHSLAFRMRRLEQGTERSRSTRARWRERLWRLCVAAALIVFGWWLKAQRT